MKTIISRNFKDDFVRKLDEYHYYALNNIKNSSSFVRHVINKKTKT